MVNLTNVYQMFDKSSEMSSLNEIAKACENLGTREISDIRRHIVIKKKQFKSIFIVADEDISSD